MDISVVNVDFILYFIFNLLNLMNLLNSFLKDLINKVLCFWKSL